MKKITILLICFLCGLQSNGQTYKVDLTKALFEEIPMSDILNDLRIVEFEMPDSLKICYTELTNDGNGLLVLDLTGGPYLFDTKGNFIKEVKSILPDSLSSKTKFMNSHYDMKRDIFYEDYYDRWLGIDIQTNKVVGQIIKPELFKKRMTSFMQISDDVYIGYSCDVLEGEPSLLAFFDSHGRILRHEPDLEPYQYGSKFPRGPFNEDKSKCYFVDPYLGTKVYEIANQHLQPYVYFLTGNKVSSDNKLVNMVETDNRIYFGFATSEQTFWGYYSKNEDQAYIASNSMKPRTSAKLDKDNFFPSFLQGANSLTSRLEGNTLRVTIGTFK